MYWFSFISIGENQYKYADNCPQKQIKQKNYMETPLETITNDLEIVIEAIKNNDTKEAIEMLTDIVQDLKIMLLMP